MEVQGKQMVSYQKLICLSSNIIWDHIMDNEKITNNEMFRNLLNTRIIKLLH